jgi:aminocarboxymuconate-semialdehyde decarboxylase
LSRDFAEFKLIMQPWLDFLPASEAVEVAKMANEDLEEWCKPCAKELETEHQSSHFVSSLPASSRIRAFGILPFSAGVATSDLVASLVDIAKSEYLKGAIIGSRGKGKGLDDPDLEPLWACAEKYNQPLFLHPHYGVGADSIGESGLFGTRENGHVLPLALGFPFETASVSTVNSDHAM